MLIVTGMSGAGRSTAANALEDLGWYVVDNLPPQMLRPLLDLTELAAGALPRVAVVVDVRGRDLFADLPEALRALRERRQIRLMFLDAADDVLVRRFEAVRRPHPLQGDGTILDGIRLERERLAAVRESADVIIDTSSHNIHQLATQVAELFSDEGARPAHAHDHELRVQVRTAARRRPRRRHALPAEPVLERGPARAHRRGRRRARVRARHSTARREFIDAYAAALHPVLEGYQRENKRHSVVAIGCTGGKHRSVVMARELAERLAAEPGVAVRVKHRDLGRE